MQVPDSPRLGAALGAILAQSPAANGSSGLVVVVRGPRKGFRRAGRLFGLEPVRIPIEELSEDEKAALIAEPMLTVTTEAVPTATE